MRILLAFFLLHPLQFFSQLILKRILGSRVWAGPRTSQSHMTESRQDNYLYKLGTSSKPDIPLIIGTKINAALDNFVKWQHAEQTSRNNSKIHAATPNTHTHMYDREILCNSVSQFARYIGNAKRRQTNMLPASLHPSAGHPGSGAITCPGAAGAAEFESSLRATY